MFLLIESCNMICVTLPFRQSFDHRLSKGSRCSKSLAMNAMQRQTSPGSACSEGGRSRRELKVGASFVHVETSLQPEHRWKSCLKTFMSLGSEFSGILADGSEFWLQIVWSFFQEKIGNHVPRNNLFVSHLKSTP